MSSITGAPHKNPAKGQIFRRVRQKIWSAVMSPHDFTSMVVTITPTNVPTFGAWFQSGSWGIHAESFLQRLEIGFIRKKLAILFDVVVIESRLVKFFEEIKSESFDGRPIFSSISYDYRFYFWRVIFFKIAWGNIFDFIDLVYADAEITVFGFPENFGVIDRWFQEALEWFF